MSTQRHLPSGSAGLLLQGYIRENYEQKHRIYVPEVLKNQCLLFAYIGDHFESHGNHISRLGLYYVHKNDNYPDYFSVVERSANGNVSIDTTISSVIVVWRIKLKIKDNNPITNRCGISLVGKSSDRKILYEIRNDGGLAYTGGVGIKASNCFSVGFANNDEVVVAYINTNAAKELRFFNQTSGNLIATFSNIVIGQEIKYKLAVDLATTGTGAEIVLFKERKI